MTVTTGGRKSQSSASPSSPKVRSKVSRSSRSSSSGLTTWMSQPSSAPSSCSVSSFTDCVAVTISPRWNRAVTSAAGWALILSPGSGRGAARGSRTVWALTRGRGGRDPLGQGGQRRATGQPYRLAVAAGQGDAAHAGRRHLVELLTALLLALAPTDRSAATRAPEGTRGARTRTATTTAAATAATAAETAARGGT